MPATADSPPRANASSTRRTPAGGVPDGDSDPASADAEYRRRIRIVQILRAFVRTGKPPLLAHYIKDTVSRRAG